MKFKKIILIILTVSLALSACSVKTPVPDVVEDVELIKDTSIEFVVNNSSEYKIVVPSTPHEGSNTAAGELNSIIKLKMPELDIITDEEAIIGGKYIAIGDTKLLTQSNITVNKRELGGSGYIIKRVDNTVLIIANANLGLLYGVFGFCQYNLGYTYYSYDEIKVSSEPNIYLKDFDLIDIPDFESRTALSYDTWTNSSYSDRLRLNGCYMVSAFDEDTWSSLNDTSLITQLAPKNKYGNDKGWLWIEKDGVIQQLNYAKALRDKEEYPKGDWSEPGYNDSEGRHGLFWTIVYNLINNYISVETTKTYFMLGMGDNDKYAKDEESLAEYEKTSITGVMIRFMNAVADEVELWRLENAPERDIRLVTFAYNAFFEAPCKKDDKGNFIADENGKFIPIDESVIVRDNVVIRFTPIYANYVYNLMDADKNPSERMSLLGWSAVASKLCIWDYRADYISFIVPYPQWLSVADNLRIYKEYGIIDIMSQGPRAGDGTPLIELDNYVRARLMWDVDLNYEEIVDDFIDNYYKEAATTIDEYIKYLTMHYKTHMQEKNYDGYIHRNLATTTYWTYDHITRIENIFLNGYKAIEPLKESDPEKYEIVKNRLDKESLFYRFMQIAFYKNYYYTNVKDTEKFNTMINEFERICKVNRFSITQLGEKGKKIESYIAEWRAALA